jgi:hypothetical protein
MTSFTFPRSYKCKTWTLERVNTRPIYLSSGSKMDLTRVKGVVKVWEKSFKIVNGREPTKDDIKKDPSGIGRS